MFPDIISNLPITGQQADEIFKNIHVDRYGCDSTWMATLRCLLYKRTDAEFSFEEERFDLDRSIPQNAAYLLNGSFTHPSFPNKIMFMYVSRACDEQKMLFDMLDSEENGIGKHFGMKKLADVSAFISTKAKCNVYINEENNSAFIIMASRRLPHRRLLQSLIPRLIPGLFKDNPITELEYNLLSSLRDTNPDAYIKAVNDIWRGFDLDSVIITSSVVRAMRGYREREVALLKTQIQEIMMQMNNLLDRYQNYLSEKDTLTTRLVGAEVRTSQEDGDPALVEYLVHNRDSIAIVGGNDRGIDIEINSYITNYDPDMFETMINNERSSLSRIRLSHCDDRFRDNETRKKFLFEIFGSEPTLKVRSCGFYRLDFAGGVRSESGRAYGANCKDRIPNPHLQMHSCLGDHARYIMDCLNSGNNIGAIEQCRASASSVNIGEGITFIPFLQNILESDEAIIELPDKRNVTSAQALDWLIENKWNGEMK